MQGFETDDALATSVARFASAVGVAREAFQFSRKQVGSPPPPLAERWAE
jgi:hypothetical protein